MKRIKLIHTGKTFFRKFTRKKYASFNSMHRVVHISTLVAAYSLIVSPVKVSAQSDSTDLLRHVELEEVEIVGQLSPAVSEDLPRLVTVLTVSETACAPQQSITDLLRYSGNIDLRQRGKAGIQSDLSIRGGSFDHNLILLNGINISDPQTGHLSLNLPLETGSVDRIEILNGSASRVHGPNAFSGAVNFITRPAEENDISLSVSGGEYGYGNNAATVNLNFGKVRNLLHYNNGFSSGYALNTDYFRQGFFYQSQIDIGPDELDVQMGFNSRAFGSNSYYTPRYPDQFEKNQLLFMALGYRTGDRIKVHPQVYWRRHRDRWEMFRVDKDWYRVEEGRSISNDTSRTRFDTSFVYTNHHLSDVYGVKVNLSTRSHLGTSTVGWHLRSENILSNAIGYEKGIVLPVPGYEDVNYHLSDSRSNMDMHIEQTLGFRRFYLSGGMLINWNSYLPNQLNYFPGLDLRIRLLSSLSLIGSYNYSLGLPTFTDLTYNDPNNQGNNELKPYTQHSLEGGLRWSTAQLQINFVSFYTQGKDVIDWVWFSEETKFKPVNIDRYSSRGIEFVGNYTAPEASVLSRVVRSVHFSFTYLDMDKEVPGDLLKYFNLRKKGSMILQSEPVRNLIVAVNLSYTDREGSYPGYDFEAGAYTFTDFEPYFLADVRLSYSIKNLTLFAEVTNLFDTDYIDTGSILQPGRWISGGLKYTIKGF